jgi:DNA-binding MarR family transcriptional regulator
MNGAREELLKSVIEKMGSIMRSMHAANEFPFGESKVGMPQIRILFYLARKQEGVSVKELAETLGVTSGAVTQFIDALVEKKLVRRQEDANDRRLLRMKLTDLAKAKFGSFKKDYFARVSLAFTTMSDEEIVRLIELLNKIDA